MNKLIIIGNGFDLAHRLPTSYKSFIDYIWKNLIKMYDDPKFSCLVDFNREFITLFDRNFENYTEFKDLCKSYIDDNVFRKNYTTYNSDIISMEYLDPSIYATHNVFRLRNIFFSYITKKNLENWVDIENFYYEVLIDLAQNRQYITGINDITQLNREFNEIKALLKHYLIEEIEKKLIDSEYTLSSNSIENLFEYQFKNLAESENQDYLLEFSPELHEEIIDFDKKFSGRSTLINRSVLFTNLFLNFNYTSNISRYIKILNTKKGRDFGKSEHIQIHGSLLDDEDTLNFGFGDEMDEKYKLLENIGENAFLDNIKSFMYLNNSNYKKLLNWIENDGFQVYIMGHSCGLSDRTLLNTVFEHQNCKSIKIFYHKNEGKDNFKELSQNISRHFNKKSLMRKKVVDKSLCSELPQDVYYTKKNFT